MNAPERRRADCGSIGRQRYAPAVNRAIWEGTTDVDAASQYPVRDWPDAGKPIRVDLQSLFAEVVVHSGVQSWVVDAVAATTKSHLGASVPVRPSILDDRLAG